MDWDVIAPMIVAIVLFLTVGGVLVLRPLSRRIADLLEVYTRERQQLGGADVQHLREVLESMDTRLRLLEDRQDFTERLLDAGPRRGHRHGGRRRADVRDGARDVNRRRFAGRRAELLREREMENDDLERLGRRRDSRARTSSGRISEGSFCAITIRLRWRFPDPGLSE